MMEKIKLFGISLILLLVLSLVCFAEAVEWIKYENPKYGYSLEYPSDWMIDSSNPLYVTLNSPENEQIEQSLTPEEMRENGYMPDITIAYYSSVKGWGAETLEEIINNNPFITNAQKIDFVGVEAWEMIMGGDKTGYTILAEYNGHLYQIGFGNRPRKVDLTETEKKILERFQFISSPVLK